MVDTMFRRKPRSGTTPEKEHHANRPHHHPETPRNPERPLPRANEAVVDAVNPLVADTFALYIKTKNFHWHVSGSHYREYHLLLDEQADQIFAMTDVLAERVRKLGGTTVRSIGHIARLTSIQDDDDDFVAPLDMLSRLIEDNKGLNARFRTAHGVCDENGDVATASLLENFIDETERRVWFLYETFVGGDHTK